MALMLRAATTADAQGQPFAPAGVPGSSTQLCEQRSDEPLPFAQKMPPARLRRMCDGENAAITAGRQQ
jgi:hypothetical protein